MSPYAGEEPLSLIFAIIPLIIAGIIAGLILWRMIPEWIALRRFRDEAPDWRVLRLSPEIEREIEALYVARRAMRERLLKDADAKTREAQLARYDALLDAALGHAVALIRGEQGTDREAERAGLDEAKRQLEALAAR